MGLLEKKKGSDNKSLPNKKIIYYNMRKTSLPSVVDIHCIVHPHK